MRVPLTQEHIDLGTRDGAPRGPQCHPAALAFADVVPGCWSVCCTHAYLTLGDGYGTEQFRAPAVEVYPLSREARDLVARLDWGEVVEPCDFEMEGID